MAFAVHRTLRPRPAAPAPPAITADVSLMTRSVCSELDKPAFIKTTLPLTLSRAPDGMLAVSVGRSAPMLPVGHASLQNTENGLALTVLFPHALNSAISDLVSEQTQRQLDALEARFAEEAAEEAAEERRAAAEERGAAA
eukprot:gene1472-11869_t